MDHWTCYFFPIKLLRELNYPNEFFMVLTLILEKNRFELHRASMPALVLCEVHGNLVQNACEGR